MASWEKQLDDALQKIADRATSVAKEVATEVANEGVKIAAKQITPHIKDEIKTIYTESVATWYASYTPKKYQRNWSVFELIDFDETSDTYIGWEFSDTNMTPGSDGRSLFDPIFVGGSHGLNRPGIKSIPVPELFDWGIVYFSETGGARGWLTYQDQMRETVQEYVDVNFPGRFKTRWG